MTQIKNNVCEIYQHNENNDNLLVAGTVSDSITDGPGLRFTLFVQGCPHHCKGCHNPQTHPFTGEQKMSVDDVFALICKNPIISGVTLSGGEPFCQAKALCKLATLIKQKHLELAIYSGYTWEMLTGSDDPNVVQLLSLADVLIDGEFILEQRSLSLKFRGSPNQRIIDVPKSLQSHSVILKDDGRWN